MNSSPAGCLKDSFVSTLNKQHTKQDNKVQLIINSMRPIWKQNKGKFNHAIVGNLFTYSNLYDYLNEMMKIKHAEDM